MQRTQRVECAGELYASLIANRVRDMRVKSSLANASGKDAVGLHPASPWLVPPRILTLRNDEVHVWRTPLDQGPSRLEEFRRLLSEDECARAARFHFPKDRERFIVARGRLRRILGWYLDSEPGALRFSYSDYGKPTLVGVEGANALRFNLSHSGGLALMAVTRGREIGVDLERIRPDFADDRIAERFFSPREVASLRALPADAQLEAFFTCWTRKEAYIKAHGGGLSLPLDRFDVSLVPGEPAALLLTRDDPGEAARWSLRELFPGAGYKAALAVEGADWQLRCWQ